MPAHGSPPCPVPLPRPGTHLPTRSIFPYSAAQLSANDQYKRLFADEHGELTVPKRLLSGACAGMTATALTHPLDTMRLRLALPNHGYRGGRGRGPGRHGAAKGHKVTGLRGWRAV